MIRRPTPPEIAYRWYTGTLAGNRLPITTDPQCGYFLRATGRKNDKATRYIPASIYLDSPTDPETGELTGPEILRCEIGGVQKSPAEEWLWLANRPISRKEYQRLLSELAFGGIVLEPASDLTLVSTALEGCIEQRPPESLSDGTKLDF